jgi:hypothetical protein
MHTGGQKQNGGLRRNSIFSNRRQANHIWGYYLLNKLRTVAHLLLLRNTGNQLPVPPED